MRGLLEEQVATSMARILWQNMNREQVAMRTSCAELDGAGCRWCGAVVVLDAGGARPRQRPKLHTGCRFRETINPIFESVINQRKDKEKLQTATLQGPVCIDLVLQWNDCFHGYCLLLVVLSHDKERESGLTEEFLSSKVVAKGWSKNCTRLELKGTDMNTRLLELMNASNGYQLMGKIIQDKTDEVSEGEKRKGKGDRGGHDKKQVGDCVGNVDTWGHKTAACWRSLVDRKDIDLF
ncbi:hypothetical protein Tco_1228139 [Tanacetum coccineum]